MFSIPLFNLSSYRVWCTIKRHPSGDKGSPYYSDSVSGLNKMFARFSLASEINIKRVDHYAEFVVSGDAYFT